MFSHEKLTFINTALGPQTTLIYIFTSLVLSSKPIAINSYLFTDNPQVCITPTSHQGPSLLFSTAFQTLFSWTPKSLKMVTAAIKLKDACSLEKKLDSVLKKKLDSVLKSRDITLPTKVRTVKAMVFPVVTYGCEIWTIKKRLSTKELMLLNCGVREDS